MLKPAEMAEFRAIFPKKKREKVVEKLHEEGKVQLESVDEKINKELDIEKENSPSELTEISGLSMEIDRILEILDRPAQPKTSKLEQIRDIWNEYFKAKKRDKEKVPIENREEAIERGKRIVESVGSKIRDANDELEKAEEKIPQLKEKVESLKILEKFELDDLNLLESSEFIYTKIGSIPREEIKSLKKSLNSGLGRKLVFLNQKIDSEREAIIILTLSDNKNKTDKILDSFRFEDLPLPEMEGKPIDVKEEFQEELEERKRKKEKQLQKIESFSEEYKEDLLVIQEILEIEKERASAFNNFSKTQETTVIQGWTPEDQKIEVRNTISEAADGMAHVKTIDRKNGNEKESPTLLRNPPILENFEVLTELFGTPGKGEIDPTPFLAFTYVLFFGIMLTDIAYGAIVLALSIGLWKGIGQNNETFRDFSIILILGSSATIIAGLITGSVFGDMPGYLNFGSIGIYNPIENPMPLLLLSLVIGLVHEYLGIVIGLYEKIEQGKLKTALGDRLSWLLLIPGSIVLIMHNFEWGSFSSPTLLISGLLVGSGLVLIIYSQGPLGIMDVFSMLGNILSYTRIMALALVTSALALTFNQIVNMVWGAPQSFPVLGVTIGIFLFIGTHIFSLVINLLSSFVHSLRLHYVEFFDKFFKGTGKSFKPFQVEREYTRIE